MSVGRERAVNAQAVRGEPHLTPDGACLTWNGVGESVGMFCDERVLDVPPADAMSSCGHTDQRRRYSTELNNNELKQTGARQRSYPAAPAFSS